MPRPEVTEIKIDEYGDEFHESWVVVRAGHISGTPGARLFDSEITHHHWIRVSVSRCSRKRDLSHDWIHEKKTILELDMSQAQWGAFVSSFGHGTGVPATLVWLQDVGQVPGTPEDSRLAQSTREVKEAGQRAMENVQKKHAALDEAFERGAGKKEMRELIRDLGWAMDGLPNNMEFAAKSLNEHVENVVTKARSDIEAMAQQAAGHELEAGTGSNPFMLKKGDE